MTNHENDRDNDRGDAADLRALSAWVDNELKGEDLLRVREQIATDPEAAERIAHYRAQKAALQALMGDEPAPHTMILRPRRAWGRHFGLAASWLSVGVVLGLLVQFMIPRLTDRPAFAQRADMAYAVYEPEQRHPVEVGADQQAHLVAWLSNRLDRPLTIPSLRQIGFNLIGGRLLPGDQGPAALLMYQNDAGERVTLYMTPVPRNMVKVRLLQDGQRRTFYWADKHIGFALSGQVPEAQLRNVAYQACAAMGGDPDRW
jgi:anti-sigma factor RsiW